MGGQRLLHEVRETATREGELAAARRRRVELEDQNRDLTLRCVLKSSIDHNALVSFD